MITYNHTNKKMEEGFKREIIDGQIVDLSKMSIEDLKKLQKKLKQEEKEILKKIDAYLK